MEFNLDTRNTLVLIVTVLNFAIGSLIYFENRKNITNFFFFFFAAIVGFWGVAMFLYRSGVAVDFTEFFSRQLYFWASLIPLSFIYFIYVFPASNYIFKRWQKYLLPIPALVVAFLSIEPGLLINTVNLVPTEETQIVFNKPYYAVYIAYMVVYFNYAYFLLFKKYLNMEKGVGRSQIGYVIIGTLITTLIGTVTNLIGPYFGFFEYNWVGQVGLIAMISAVAYAILRYQLFNIRLIFVEIALLFLNMFMFLNIFTSHTRVDYILNISVFVAVVVFSAYLILGIKNEIRDRERIEELAWEKAKGNEHLRMMETQKTEFVSIASHQLRTPLTLIKGYASMTLEGTFGSINGTAREAMEKLFDASVRVASLVEDLLTVSRIEQGRVLIDFRQVNFKAFAKSVVDEMQGQAREAKLYLSFSVDENRDFFVSIDEHKFKQAVRHIIDNAIKYSVGPGFVYVTILFDRVANKVRLVISDSGAGMTPEQIDSIYKRYNLKTGAIEKMYDDEGEALEGHTHGIGLYIAQEIIEAHHGTIDVKSAGPGSGTTVVVELPPSSSQ